MNVSVACVPRVARDHARAANCPRGEGGTPLAERAGMQGLACCAACGGFIPDPSAACLHCGAPPAPRRGLARFLLTRLLGVAASVTLMACYGDMSHYDCYDDGTCPCYADSECPTGEYCEEATTQQCEWGGTCTDDLDCPDGYDCDESRSTCVPAAPDDGCQSHYDCALPEQQCDFATGACVPAVSCEDEGASCGEGARCEPALGICVPCDGEACGTCTGEVTCATPPPACPEGTRPAIEYGCYTAACIAEATCVAEECLALDREACSASGICEPVYIGIDCTNPDGSPCSSGAGCTCASYEYDRCVPTEPPPA
jgi:hypothetical protein